MGRFFAIWLTQHSSARKLNLRRWGDSNPGARPVSVILAGETGIDFMIMKEALRGPERPRVICEMEYQASKASKVDICFVDSKDHPYASFELKVLADFNTRGTGGWPSVCKDIEKHLRPSVQIRGAHDDAERHSALILISEARKSREELERMIVANVSTLLRDPVFWASDPIELNRLQSTNPNAARWRYLHVVVFTGTYVGEKETA